MVDCGVSVINMYCNMKMLGENSSEVTTGAVVNCVKLNELIKKECLLPFQTYNADELILKNLRIQK